ncbi:MAG: multidrug effflux MFS transporter [Hyphomicrobiales bacterium]|nr:multidrug effflux MFS transporter [Hyphomicrobiales bacterium]
MGILPTSVYLDRKSPPHITTLVLMAGTGAISMNIFLASLPEMANYYDQPYSIMQFTLTGYLALTGFAQLFIGPVSDRVGRRPVMLATVVIFIIASLGAALSTQFEIFMAFRLLQAAVVSGFVISRAAVRDMVSRERAASMLGYVAMGMALAPMMAPPLGGLLADNFGWQSNFYAMSLIGCITLTIIFFDQGETNLHRSSSFTAQIGTYPDLFTSRRFWGYALIQVFAVGTFFAFLGGAPFVGDKFFDLSASQVGLYLALTPLGYMLGAGISGRFADRIGLYRMIVAGALITLLGMSMTLVTAGLGVAHPMGFFGFTIFIGLGNGLVLPSANAGMLDVKPELAGSASGLGGSLMTFGGASLSALSGFLLTETSGAYPLIYCILGASFLSFLSTIYTIRVEIEMRGTI